MSSSREIALLTNPAAGKGRGLRVRDEVLPRFRSAGLTVRSLVGRDADEALDLARASVADGVEAVVVVGGDGMVNLGLQVTASTPTALGIIPAGTGNDVARTVGLTRKDPMAAADRIVRALATGERRRMDLARTGGRYYATVMAAGFDAVVNERANTMRWPRGQMRYNLATLAELRTFTPRPYVLDLDGTEVRLEAMLVAIGNGPSFGGGLRIAEGALLDDGLLDVVVIKPMSRLGLVRTYPRLFRGTHTTHPQYERHRARRVTVAAPGIVGYADGERFGPLPLTIECVPDALGVLA
ncbi:YegS/Rv2252/BmrU family lipid kinase [Nocardioides dongxiaopingii]|uniref:YegS/Rv2252/BmrU family lipid kinase n=1 Tax=Nocardioides sp. S-1144 TaxID=2582905 RepID=UPI00110DE5E9|nr:YegS/Rv2252/BmrU family lipid kinase [Nocardioides sp. S-1144]QCW50727.1 YegS/Rv2252/BmrU family lipid kinase [Nocardioides sp. S-1144]